jgi:hypothetical protein
MIAPSLVESQAEDRIRLIVPSTSPKTGMAADSIICGHTCFAGSLLSIVNIANMDNIIY